MSWLRDLGKMQQILKSVLKEILAEWKAFGGVLYTVGLMQLSAIEIPTLFLLRRLKELFSSARSTMLRKMCCSHFPSFW